MESSNPAPPGASKGASLEREEAVFSAALARPRPERRQYLDEQCGSEAELRARIEALLAAAEAAEGFLETPPTLLPEVNPTLRVNGDLPGERIGHYVLLNKLGEGGAGVVYEAEQQEPVRRRVALKLMKPGTDTEAAIARFEAERQALAMMAHPNIAQVFDAGAAENGRLYFAMELVRGERITAFCDRNRLGTAERLRLFVQVCHAVQHAHQKGVIHRDLKPSNILVSFPDGEDCSWGRGPRTGLVEAGHSGTAVPKIIDFGIAKAVEGTLSDATQLTTLEQLIGTPAYMSPEQAAFGARDIDTRTDIYSLGVLLYELLTGRTPFDTEELLRVGIGAVQQVIREREPLRPSESLGAAASAALAKVADQRGTEPRALVRALRGDLDWIVIKCLEKDRQRRYATANELALDIGRFLASEAVVARPPSYGYRLRKYARRNRTPLLAAAAVISAVLVGLAFAVEGFVEAVHARREAEVQRESAIAARDESEAVTAFLSDTLAAASPWRGGPEVTVRRLLDESGPKVALQFGDRPPLEARLHETIGGTYSSLGLFEQAREHLVAAARIREAALGAEHELTLRARVDLAWALCQIGKATAADAEALARAAIAAYERHPEYPRHGAARARHALGEALHQKFDAPGAIENCRVAAALLERELGPLHADTISARHTLVKALFIAGQYPEARAICRSVCELEGLSPDDPWRIRLLSMATNTETELGAAQRAEALAAEGLVASRRVYGDENSSTIMLQAHLGFAQVQRGSAGGLALLEDAVKQLSGLLSPVHVNNVSFAARLVVPYVQAGRYEDAIAIGREANRRYLELSGGRYHTLVAVWSPSLAQALTATGQTDEAEALCRQALDDFSRVPLRHEYAISRMRIALAGVFAAQGRWGEAERELLANHATLSALDFDVRDQMRRTCAALADLCASAGRADEALRWRGELESIPAPE